MNLLPPTCIFLYRRLNSARKMQNCKAVCTLKVFRWIIELPGVSITTITTPHMQLKLFTHCVDISMNRLDSSTRVEQILKLVHHHPRFKVVFHMLLGSRYAVQRSSFYSVVYVPGSTFCRRVSAYSVVPGLLWPADGSHPLHHQSKTHSFKSKVFFGLLTGAVPSTTNLTHSFTQPASSNMSMPPQSVSSQHIPSCLYT